MTYPIGLTLIILFSFLIAFGKFYPVLHSLGVEKNTFLALILLFVLTVLFDTEFNIGAIEVQINSSLYFMLILFLVFEHKQYYKPDVRTMLAAILVTAAFIFINFSIYISEYFTLMFSPIAIPFVAVVIINLLCSCFRSGISALFYGYLAAEMIMLFFKDGNQISIGGIGGLNQFCLFLVYYFLFFWLRGKILGFKTEDIY